MFLDDHAFQSANTDQFIDYLAKNMLSLNPDAVTQTELDACLNKPGIPEFATRTQAQGFALVDAARSGRSADGRLPDKRNIDHWVTQQWVHFLSGLGEQLKPEQLEKLDQAYHFTGTPNGEIAMRLYPLVIRSGPARSGQVHRACRSAQVDSAGLRRIAEEPE